MTTNDYEDFDNDVLGNAENVSTSTHPPNDLFREIAILWLAINLIDAAPRRVRRALEKQIGAVMEAVKAFGFRIPILVRKKPGGERYEVVDGHIRLEAARRLGAEQLPCIVVDDLSDLDIRRLALSLNKLQETGQWDRDSLALEITEIIEIGGTFEIPGFEMAEIEGIRFGAGDTESADPADDISEQISENAELITRPGDIWALGDHRIHCCSARDGGAVAALLSGEIADVIFTDPPYNVPVSGHVSTVNGKHAEFAEASGEMSREAFVAFLAETLGNAVHCLKPGGVIFACIDWGHVMEMIEALESLGLKLLNICVWVKGAPGMGGLYRSQHELVVVAQRPGEKHMNNVQLGKYGRNRSNVWTYAGATGGARDAEDDFSQHPTVKPIRMIMDALLDVTAPGELVLDPFLGSGSTLLAAERAQRRCIGVEIEPRYVDVAIRRWQAMTGGEAVLVGKGQMFGELASGDPCASAPSVLADDQEGF